MKMNDDKVRGLIQSGLTPSKVEHLTIEARRRKRSMEQISADQGYDPDIVGALRDRWGITYRNAQA